MWLMTSVQNEFLNWFLAFIEQLDGDLEGIMSARALSDAETQYYEVVELTALVEKYELQ